MRLRLALPAAIAVAAVVASCSGGKHRRSPHAPVTVSAVGGDGAITITWAESPGAASYNLYYARESGVTQEGYAALLDGGRNSNVGSPLHFDSANGQTWFFVVTAISADGYQSEDSQEVYASATPWPDVTVVEGANADAITGALSKDANGNLFAVWSRQKTNRYSILSSRFDVAGGAWAAPATLDSDAGYSYAPRVATKADGTSMAVWRQGNTTRDDIWMNVWTSGPQWGTPVRVEFDDTGSARNPDVAAGAGPFLVTWSQFDGVRQNVFGIDWSGTFGTQTALDTSTTVDADLPRVAADGAGNGAAVFVQGGAILTARFSGGSWQMPIVLSTTTNGATSPAIAMNAAGDAIAAWLEPNPAGFDAFGATFAAGVWSTAARLEFAAGTCGPPSVAISEDGHAVAAFSQINGLHKIARAVRRAAGAWQIADRIDGDDTGDVKEIAVASGTSSDTIAVWTQDVVGPGGTSKNVYSNRYLTLDSAWGTAVLASPFGLNDNPSVVIGSGGVATVLWTRLTPAGSEVLSNRLPLPIP